nr:MAG TPA: hypothetical protein [Caudoviricetes sp.]
MSHSAGLCPEPFIVFAQDAEKHPAFARCSLILFVIHFFYKLLHQLCKLCSHRNTRFLAGVLKLFCYFLVDLICFWN